MGPPPMATNTTTDTPDRNMRAGSAFRQTTPAPTTGNGSLPTGTGRSISRAGTPSYQVPQQAQGVYSSPNQPFEDVLLRQRNLGQDIIPSPLQPKRTESLYLPPKPLGGGGGGGGGGKPKVAKVSLHFDTFFVRFAVVPRNNKDILSRWNVIGFSQNSNQLN